jgi:hypothetical protein
MNPAERLAHETDIEAQRQREEAEQQRQRTIHRREAPTLVYKTTQQPEPTAVAPTTRWVEQYFAQTEYVDGQFSALHEALGEVIGTGWRNQREEWEQADAEIKASIEGLQRELISLREQAERERALSARAAEVYAQERALIVQDFKSQVEAALGARAHELDLIRRELEVRVELDYQRDALRTKAAEADRVELVASRRDIEQLREQIGVERGLRDLRSEVAEAQKQIPQVPALFTQLQTETWTAQIEADKKIAALERELRATKDKLSKLRVQNSETQHSVKRLERQAPTATAAIEIETSTRLFSMRGLHPEAAKTLRAFANEVIDAKDHRPIWLSPPAGTA